MTRSDLGLQDEVRDSPGGGVFSPSRGLSRKEVGNKVGSNFRSVFKQNIVTRATHGYADTARALFRVYIRSLCLCSVAPFSYCSRLRRLRCRAVVNPTQIPCVV